MRLDAAVSGYLSHCGSERRLSPLTVSAYGADLRDFQAFAVNHALVADVSAEVLKAYLGTLNDARKLSVATVKRRFATLQGMFKWACAESAIENPFASWRPKLRRPKRLPRALTRPELTDLIASSALRARDVASFELTHLAIVLMAATGIRVSEMCALTLEDTAPDGSALRIRGKGARDRMVYVSNAWLRQHLVAWRTRRAAASRTAAAPFFTGRSGARLRPAAFRGRLKRAGAPASRRVTPHMLRHTAATLLIEEGVDIRLVQRLLGHASIATTEIYTHVADETLRRTLARADIVGLVVGKATL